MTQTPAQQADDLAALVLDVIDDQLNETARQIVYARVLRALQAHRLYVPPKPSERKVEPMTAAQAIAFEAGCVPFGKYDGSPVGAVPIGYLCRLCDPSVWIEDLRRYLASERGKRRIEEET